MEIHSGHKVISAKRTRVMEEIGGTYLQPFMVNKSHFIGKQVMKLLQAEKHYIYHKRSLTTEASHHLNEMDLNTLWTGDADLRLYITTVQDR